MLTYAGTGGKLLFRAHHDVPRGDGAGYSRGTQFTFFTGTKVQMLNMPSETSADAC
jgi:hypothetical protein